MKSKKFYKEAEDMSDGWGKALMSIDKLRDKFNRGERLSLSEACWVLWAEKGVCSSGYRSFEAFIKRERLDVLLHWPIWYGLYTGYQNQQKEEQSVEAD